MQNPGRGVEGLLHGPPTGETLGRELLEEEFDTTIMSHGKLLHASVHRQLKEAFARSRY